MTDTTKTLDLDLAMSIGGLMEKAGLRMSEDCRSVIFNETGAIVQTEKFPKLISDIITAAALKMCAELGDYECKGISIDPPNENNGENYQIYSHACDEGGQPLYSGSAPTLYEATVQALESVQPKQEGGE